MHRQVDTRWLAEAEKLALADVKMHSKVFMYARA